jgi:hypothetical protein
LGISTLIIRNFLAPKLLLYSEAEAEIKKLALITTRNTVNPDFKHCKPLGSIVMRRSPLIMFYSLNGAEFDLSQYDQDAYETSAHFLGWYNANK